MNGKKLTAVCLLLGGLAMLSVPFIRFANGSHRSREILYQWEQVIWKEIEEPEVGFRQEENSSEEELIENLLEGVIGKITIEAIGVEYLIAEGVEAGVLAYAVGHMPETAGVGEVGNCVLAGHRGSRYGTFFKYLHKVSVGDEVRIMDGKGNEFVYLVKEVYVTEPYDQTVIEQGEKSELTLVTCESKGTMRLIVRCIEKVEGISGMVFSR